MKGYCEAFPIKELQIFEVFFSSGEYYDIYKMKQFSLHVLHYMYLYIKGKGHVLRNETWLVCIIRWRR